MPPQSVRRVANDVVAQGWAHWQPNPGRRGQNLLVLTDKGRRAITALTAEQHAWADAVGQEIGERDLKTLATLISRVTEASRRYPASRRRGALALSSNRVPVAPAPERATSTSTHSHSSARTT